MKIKDFIKFIREYTEKVLLKGAEPDVCISSLPSRKPCADHYLTGKTWQCGEGSEYEERRTGAFSRTERAISPEKGFYDYRTRCRMVFDEIAGMAGETEYNGYSAFYGRETAMLIFDFDFLWALCEEYRKRGLDADGEFAEFAAILMWERYEYVKERSPLLAAGSLEKEEDMPIYETAAKAMIGLELSFFDEDVIKEAVDAFSAGRREVT